VRLLCQMHSQGKGLVTTRPDAICPAELNKPSKDANDVLQHHGVEAVQALMASAQRIPPFSEFERKAIIDAACEVDNAAYANGRDRIASLLEWRKADLDGARKARIKELVNAGAAKLEERDTPWPDPVPDLGLVLDELVAELVRYVVAPLPGLHTATLFGAFAHLIHHEHLRINISPRLLIQAPDKECGKSVLTEAIACVTPRPNMVLAPSAASVFRSIHADRCTLLVDEAIAHLANNHNPDLHTILLGGHRRATAWIPRTERREDGSFDPVKYNCFTAIVLNGIGVFSDQLQDRGVTIFLQRALVGEVREHLVNAESEALIVIRRKLARWAEDLRELPPVDRPKALSNRKGDNWFPLRQIAELAGGEWPARAWTAAIGGPSPLALNSRSALTELLDGLWEVFDVSKQERMFSSSIVSKLLEIGEGQWKQVKGGRGVDEYYLRETLRGVIPRSEELDKARRWREGGNTQFGYTIAHLRDPWLRYLGKSPPQETPAEPPEEETPQETQQSHSPKPSKNPEGPLPRGATSKRHPRR
jgi:putative DNA primase/helicase